MRDGMGGQLQCSFSDVMGRNCFTWGLAEEDCMRRCVARGAHMGGEEIPLDWPPKLIKNILNVSAKRCLCKTEPGVPTIYWC